MANEERAMTTNPAKGPVIAQTMESLLLSNLGQDSEAKSLYESLELARAMAADRLKGEEANTIGQSHRPGEGGFTVYKSQDTLEAGIKAGLYLQGSLKVRSCT